MKKIILLSFLAVSLISCQFTETMVMNEDGSGRMSIEMDLSAMMAIGGEMSKDTTAVKQDTIIAFKDIFEEKKDSIAKLPEAEQQRLKAMEDYKIRMISDPDENILKINIFTDFNSVAEANDLLKGLEQAEGVMPDESQGGGSTSEPEAELIGVNYSYSKGKFVRDAYIKDEKQHAAQVDSMKQVESFMGETAYKIKYTFPRRIKSSSVEDATYSLDGKTIEITRGFLDYFKNPDVLDLEVELEN